jgi:F-type H+-transporting ATPase subunit b
MASHDAAEQVAGTEVPGGAHEGSAFPPFDPTHFSSQLIWLAITFGAVYLLMAKVALPRVTNILETRKAKIESDLQMAAKAQEEAAAAAAAHQKTLNTAKANAQALAQATHTQLAAEADARRHALETDLNAKMAEAEAKIAQTKATAMANVNGIASETAQAILQHLTGQPADSAAVEAALAAHKA